MQLALPTRNPLQVKNVSEAVPSYSVRIGDARPTERPHSFNPPPPAADPASSREELFLQPGSIGMYGALAGLTVLVAVINLLTSMHDFWAKWPITVFALEERMARLDVLHASFAGQLERVARLARQVAGDRMATGRSSRALAGLLSRFAAYRVYRDGRGAIAESRFLSDALAEARLDPLVDPEAIAAIAGLFGDPDLEPREPRGTFVRVFNQLSAPLAASFTAAFCSADRFGASATVAGVVVRTRAASFSATRFSRWRERSV